MREGGIGKGGREEEGSREGAKDYVMMDMLIDCSDYFSACQNIKMYNFCLSIILQ
jgi:hypothetical protein